MSDGDRHHSSKTEVVPACCTGGMREQPGFLGGLIAHRQQVLEPFADESGLISEHDWDPPDLPEHGQHLGRPSGSTMPPVWAHAKYRKRQRSRRDG